MIPTLTHGLLDHLLGILLIASPWIFNFHAGSTAAVKLPLLCGAALVVVCLFTRFEMGLGDVFTVKRHMQADILVGTLLAASPFLFGFHQEVMVPHIIGGVCIISLALFSARKPFDENAYTEIMIRNGRVEVVRYARSTDHTSIDPLDQA